MLAQCCTGLIAMHKMDMVHKDIKPENLFITGEGVLKLGDLGLAGLIGNGWFGGTGAYMSPEMCKLESL